MQVEDVEISKDTLATLMDEYKDSVDGYVCSYYKVLTSPETKWVEEENFYGLGGIKFGVLLMDDDASRRVAMVRQTGMKIKDQGSISGYIPFMGVMLIEGDEINTRLRLIENPQHTAWEPQRSANELQARELLSALNNFMKQKVGELASQGSAMELDAVGLGDLLPDDIDADADKSKEENVSNATEVIESKVVIQKERKVTVSKAKTKTVDGDAEEGEEVPGWLVNPDPDPNPPHPHPPKPVDIVPGDKTKVQQPKVIGIEKFVFYSPNRKEGKYTLSIVPAESGENGIIELQIAGEVYSFPATIKSATKSGVALTVEENRIKDIQFEKGKQLRISVELACKDYCALEVSAYAD